MFNKIIKYIQKKLPGLRDFIKRPTSHILFFVLMYFILYAYFSLYFVISHDFFNDIPVGATKRKYLILNNTEDNTAELILISQDIIYLQPEILNTLNGVSNPLPSTMSKTLYYNKNINDENSALYVNKKYLLKM